MWHPLVCITSFTYMDMAPDITIRYFNDENENIIAKAVGYPGVVAFGRSQQQVEARIREAWNAMAQFNAIKSIGDVNRPIYSGGINEKKIPLQLV